MTERPAATQAATGKTPVLFVHSATLPPLGADTWIHALIMRHLDRKRVDVHVACALGEPGARTPTFDAIAPIRDIKLCPVNLGPEMFRRSRLGKARAALETIPALRSLAELAQYVRRHGIKILHTSDRPRDALVCALVARMTGAKLIVHVHVKYGEWMSPMLRWAMSKADALVGVSAFVARSLVLGGYPSEKTHAILNAVDLPVWDPGTDGRGVREEFGIPEDAPLLVCVARIYVAKGQAELIRALALVRRERPDVHLLIVGQDYPAGTHFSAELRQLASDLDVAEAVHFAGQRKDVPRLLAASDIYAMPSWEEPFGLAYAEAMAMKRPVVALDDGGTPEVVQHDRDGLLSKRDEIERLAAHISRLVEDPALRARMGDHGRRTVEERFTGERIARDVEALYARLAI